ncbi:hypothetical protein AAIR98_001910 [Elusimicrobium simillimum]|uniref:D-alanyl-D-alanine carboxypeptidase family protein n=1 Tax=Elusimicrobium simillimum TaxID=3143438 RepID=UPI003C6F2239
MKKYILFTFIVIFITSAVFAQNKHTNPARTKALNKILAFEGINAEAVLADEFAFAFALRFVVGNLEVFRRIDQYPVGDQYEPVCLMQIDEHNSNGGKIPVCRPGLELTAATMPDLDRLMRDAKREKLTLSILSATRTPAQQKQIKKQYARRGMAKYAASGYTSQHLLGTTVDFRGKKRPFIKNGKEVAWLAKNSEKYGFVMTLGPDANPYEPWHYRYMGREGVYLKNNIFDGSWKEALKFIDAHIDDILTYLEYFDEIPLLDYIPPSNSIDNAKIGVLTQPIYDSLPAGYDIRRAQQ